VCFQVTMQSPEQGERLTETCYVPPGKDPSVYCPGYEYDEGECSLDYSKYRRTGDVDDIGLICRRSEVRQTPEPERTIEIDQGWELQDRLNLNDTGWSLAQAGFWVLVGLAVVGLFMWVTDTSPRAQRARDEWENWQELKRRRVAPRARRRRSARWRRSCFFYVVAGPRWVKFGISTRPARRLRAHARSGEFDHLVVLSEYSSVDRARRVERSALKWRDDRGLARADRSLDGYTETIPTAYLQELLNFLGRRGDAPFLVVDAFGRVVRG